MLDLTDSPLPQLPPRDVHSHKGDFGRALVIGGSLGMAGAPALAATSCLWSGAGLVTVAMPRCVLPFVASFEAALMTAPLDDDGERLVDGAGPAIARLARGATAVAIGPGLGRSDAVTRVVGAAWELPRPMVIDADGLNGLADLLAIHRADPRPAIRLATPAAPRVLTPHAGEFARLTGAALDDPNNDRERIARAGEFARAVGGPATVVVLKGARTVVTDGERVSLNSTGNPGMATGGSGDVLTGVVLALLCQGMAPFDAARLAAHAHGLAGDLAAAKLGQVAMTAGDVVAHLGDAWRSLGFD
jgi:NAD(P)H-hydrate epimerase